LERRNQSPLPSGPCGPRHRSDLRDLRLGFIVIADVAHVGRVIDLPRGISRLGFIVIADVIAEVAHVGRVIDLTCGTSRLGFIVIADVAHVGASSICLVGPPSRLHRHGPRGRVIDLPRGTSVSASDLRDLPSRRHRHCRCGPRGPRHRSASWDLRLGVIAIAEWPTWAASSICGGNLGGPRVRYRSRCDPGGLRDRFRAERRRGSASARWDSERQVRGLVQRSSTYVRAAGHDGHRTITSGSRPHGSRRLNADDVMNLDVARRSTSRHGAVTSIATKHMTPW
jgi:hypothetical protein